MIVALWPIGNDSFLSGLCPLLGPFRDPIWILEMDRECEKIQNYCVVAGLPHIIEKWMCVFRGQNYRFDNVQACFSEYVSNMCLYHILFSLDYNSTTNTCRFLLVCAISEKHHPVDFEGTARHEQSYRLRATPNMVDTRDEVRHITHNGYAHSGPPSYNYLPKRSLSPSGPLSRWAFYPVKSA